MILNTTSIIIATLQNLNNHDNITAQTENNNIISILIGFRGPTLENEMKLMGF